MTVSLKVKYKAGHSYDKTFEKVAEFCPHCAKPEVWMETSGEDYYVGANYICIACCHEFNLPVLRDVSDADKEPVWKQVIDAIKAAR